MAGERGAKTGLARPQAELEMGWHAKCAVTLLLSSFSSKEQ